MASFCSIEKTAYLNPKVFVNGIEVLILLGIYIKDQIHMSRCCYEKLKNLEAVFTEVRKLAKIKEPKPGIFYFKSQGFMHFHDKDGKVWADLKHKGKWISIDVPPKPSLLFLNGFLKQIKLIHADEITQKAK